jgi:hypothetical protein
MENLNSKNSFPWRSIFSFPNYLPLLGAGMGYLLGVSYYFGLMIMQFFVGRPSSTWIIGILWLPFLTYKHTLIGLCLGCIAWCIVKVLHHPRQVSKTTKWILGVLVASIMLISAAFGGLKTVVMASHFAPQVIYTSNEIIKIKKVPFGSTLTIHPSLLWKMTEKSSGQSIVWNGKEIHAYGDGDSLIIRDKAQVLTQIKLGTEEDEIRHIHQVYGFPIQFEKKAGEHLAMLMRVRAIRDCWILIILNPQSQLVYKEILKEIENPIQSMQKIKDQNSGKEVLIITDKQTSIYGSKP